jgi:hypothetical protein
MSHKAIFLTSARATGIREDLAGILYETLTEVYRARQVTIEANLYKSFGIVDDELEMVITDIASKARLRLPDPRETARMPPIQTVRDLLLFLAGLSSAA